MRSLTLSVLFAVTMTAASPLQTTRSQPMRRMSFHNRLLLNRAVVSGLKSIKVLVLAAKTESAGFHASTQEIARLVGRLGGRVLRIEGDIGYVHLELPTERLVTLTDSTAIEAYQIASLSKAAWYRDGPPLMNAEMFRGFEVTPIAATEPNNSYAELAPLSIEASREPGYTADDDVGLREWMAAHPTFDGRGVTIALVENALPSFTDPTLRTAKSLDGRDIPKIAGIVDTVEPDNDDTRVALDTPVRAETSWARIGGRTYILPRPGSYRFGMLVLSAGGNVMHQFGVIQDEQMREVWIDANGDASFQDESPLADVNDRFEPRFLKLSHPRKEDLSFVMGRGHAQHVVHVYVSRGSHQTMTLSVAAGSKMEASLAYGVAPNARVLLVRTRGGADYDLRAILEGFLAAAQRPDVDVISSSSGITIVPDTALDFAGLLFQRLTDAYQKPLVNGAGNTYLQLGTSIALGGSLSVGGSLGPRTLAALYGGRTIDTLIVHPAGAAGPGLDGAIKPDFVAPMERLAADLPWNRDLEAVPANEPTHRIPPGYQISCCTSASSPYAAGVAALLISAAKQRNVPYSAETLARAMTLSARFLQGFGSHQQGNGVLDINAAWRELVGQVDVPRITASAGIVHPLAQYAVHGSEGVGIMEFNGWTAGMTGTRGIRLRRESGPASSITYHLTWTGNDGTFATTRSITLPLGRTVAVPITIAPKATGAHSALLNLRDVSSGAVVFRTQATIIAAKRIDAAAKEVRVAGRVSVMRTAAHYLTIPAGTSAISFELHVVKGLVSPAILPASGLFPSYYPHVHPMSLRSVSAGKHMVTLPHPEPGTWAVLLRNRSTWLHLPDDPPADDRDAEYLLTIRVRAASIRPLGSASEGDPIENSPAGRTTVRRRSPG